MPLSLADSTMKQYTVAIKQWLVFCDKFQINPYQADENQAVRWLTDRFQAEASYGTINTCRAVLGLLLGEKVSQGATITRFLRGVFWLRPTKPRYEDTWDVTPVLENVATFFPLDSLSLS